MRIAVKQQPQENRLPHCWMLGIALAAVITLDSCGQRHAGHADTLAPAPSTLPSAATAGSLNLAKVLESSGKPGSDSSNPKFFRRIIGLERSGVAGRDAWLAAIAVQLNTDANRGSRRFVLVEYLGSRGNIGGEYWMMAFQSQQPASARSVPAAAAQFPPPSFGDDPVSAKLHHLDLEAWKQLEPLLADAIRVPLRTPFSKVAIYDAEDTLLITVFDGKSWRSAVWFGLAAGYNLMGEGIAEKVRSVPAEVVTLCQMLEILMRHANLDIREHEKMGFWASQIGTIVGDLQEQPELR